MVLNVIAKDLRRLAMAARKLGDGHYDSKSPIDRHHQIGELAKSFATMQQRLLTDRLTGIANHEAIVRRIEDRIICHRRQGEARPFAVLFVDLNAFRQINDRCGHNVGNRVLIEIGQRLTASLCEADLAVRFGGDEFIVLRDKVANRETVAVARNKLERALAAPLQSLKEIAPERPTLSAGPPLAWRCAPNGATTSKRCSSARPTIRRLASRHARRLRAASLTRKRCQRSTHHEKCGTVFVMCVHGESHA